MMIQSGSGTIDWGATGKNRIAQNVRNLVNTFRYEVAYHRTMGLPAGIVDSPTPEAAAELEIEVRTLLARYEPRAQIKNVSVRAGQDGKLRIEVELQ